MFVSKFSRSTRPSTEDEANIEKLKKQCTAFVQIRHPDFRNIFRLGNTKYCMTFFSKKNKKGIMFFCEDTSECGGIDWILTKEIPQDIKSQIIFSLDIFEELGEYGWGLNGRKI